MSLIEAWLAKATRGLSAESAASVFAEINEHYQSSYGDALAGGHTVEEAERAAVAALGDASRANRQYRRVLLTAREAKYLRLLTPRAPRNLSHLPPSRLKVGKWLARILFAEAIGFLALVAWRSSPWLFAVFPFFVLILVHQLISINTPFQARIYRCAKWGALIGGAAIAAWYDVKPEWAPFVPLLYPAYAEYLRMSIRRKLLAAQWPKSLYH